MESVRVRAPAKVNLRLVILSRQTTGYHNLETVLSGISLADRIQLWAGDGIEFETLAGAVSMGPPEENLVVRAALEFYAWSGIEPSARIRLEKRIPSAAGLGGGERVRRQPGPDDVDRPLHRRGQIGRAVDHPALAQDQRRTDDEREQIGVRQPQLPAHHLGRRARLERVGPPVLGDQAGHLAGQPLGQPRRHQPRAMDRGARRHRPAHRGVVGRPDDAVLALPGLSVWRGGVAGGEQGTHVHIAVLE